MLIERAEKYRKLVGIRPPINELLPEIAHLIEWTVSTRYYIRDELHVTFLLNPRRVSKVARNIRTGSARLIVFLYLLQTG